MAEFKIVTAYAYSPKFKTYTVGAYVLETLHDGLPCGHTFKALFNYAIDDTRDAATQEAVARIYRGNMRHPQGMEIENRGRVSLELVTGGAF
jgi:hypothetical protein